MQPSSSLQVKQICDEFRTAFAESPTTPPVIEDFLERLPEERQTLLGLLCKTEWELRVASGQHPSRQEYLSRFPSLDSHFVDALESFTNDISDLSLQTIGLATDVDIQGSNQQDAIIPVVQSKGSHTNSLHLAGTMVGGYQLEQLIGKGGMGVVYRAKQISLDRQVAVKLIRAEFEQDPKAWKEYVDRFQRESLAVATIDHDNVVRVFDAGNDCGQLYLVMELVDGQSLSDRIQEKGVIEPIEAAKILVRLAAAIDSLGEKQIIHRDLKPENVLLTHDGVPKIADFGLAKSTQHHQGQTIHGYFVGTPQFAAPEQARLDGSSLTVATDVYGLGALLYAMLVGQPPFPRDTLEATLQRVLHQPVVPVRRLIPECPRDLETICLKCLEKEPARRYSSAGFLREDLRRFISGEPIHARPVGKLEQGYLWARRNKTLSALLAALACAILGLLGIFILRYKEAQENAITQGNLRGMAEKREKEALFNATKAEQSRDQLLETLDLMFAPEARRVLQSQTTLSDQQRQFYTSALSTYQSLIDQTNSAEPNTLTSANASIRVGFIQATVFGLETEGFQNIDIGINALQAAWESRPTERDVIRNHLANALAMRASTWDPANLESIQSDFSRILLLFGGDLNALVDSDPQVAKMTLDTALLCGYSMKSRWHSARAAEAYQIANFIAEALIQKDSSSPELQVLLIESKLGLVTIGVQVGTESAEEAALKFEDAIASLNSMAEKYPYLLSVKVAGAKGKLEYAKALYRNLDRGMDSLDYFVSCEDAIRDLLNEQPGDRRLNRDLLECYLEYSAALFGVERSNDAEIVMEKADHLLSQLSNNYPEIEGYKSILATLKLILLTQKSAKNGTLANIDEWTRKWGLGIVPGTQDSPARIEFGRLAKDADVHHANGKLEKAITAYTKAIDYHHSQAMEYGELYNTTDLLGLHYWRADARRYSDKVMDAMPDYEEVLKIFDDRFTSDSLLPRDWTFRAWALCELGLIHENQLMKPAKAREYYANAITAFGEAIDKVGRNADLISGVGGNLCNLANAWRGEDPQRSLGIYAESITSLRDAVREFPSDQRLRSFLQNAWWGEARAHELLSNHRNSVEAWTQAIRYAQPENLATFYRGRAQSHTQLGDGELALNDLKEAIANSSESVMDRIEATRLLCRLYQHEDLTNRAEVLALASEQVKQIRETAEEHYTLLIEDEDFAVLRELQIVP